ncbi:TetR family transcriptional regulator [Phenylobacterium sp. LjRoot225]|uniref:TetR/AcrR family transcriptional regulator n=1 Tax=Phenylobacterium sp. LjRoot225 TaxID=3342285 RepID=UPI003ED14956
MQRVSKGPLAPAAFPDTSTSADPVGAGDAAPARSNPRRGRGRLRVQDARELEAQLIAAAQDAFTIHGYGATSMAALARSAGVSKTTLYAKFPTKAALFRAIIDQQLDRAYGAVQETAGDAPKTLPGRLRHLAEQTLQAASLPENLKINRLIDWEAPRFPELAEIARVRGRLGIEHIASYIREFAAKDQVPCRDPEGAAAIFNFMIRGLYYDIQIGVRSPSPEELRAMIAKIVAAFLASRSTW